jgi:hypothetical protein
MNMTSVLSVAPIALELALLGGQVLPHQRAVQLVRPEFLDRVWERVRRPDLALDRGKRSAADLQLPEPLPPRVAERVPPVEVELAVLRDVLGRGVDREVGGGEREVLEERLVGVLLRVLLEAPDRVVGDRGAGVVPVAGPRRGQRLVVLGVLLRAEVPVVVVEAVRAVEPAVEGLTIDVPLARVVRPVALRLQHLGQEPRPRRPHALCPALHAGDDVAAHLLRVVPGEDRGPRRPAPTGVVELREPQPVRGERVEVRGRDLAAVAPGVGESHVVHEDEKDVRLRRVGGARRGGGQKERGEQAAANGQRHGRVP